MTLNKGSLLIPALLLFASLSIGQTKSSPETAKPTMTQQDEFLIVGMEARTNAAKEMSDQGIIPQLWQRFMQEGTLQKIPNKADQNLYVIYTAFSDKRSGDYSVVIGARVTDKSQVPEGLVLKTVPAGKYLIFQSEQGPAWEVIPAAWKKLADTEDKGQLGYTRAYQADYEVYDLKTFNPQNLRAELHIGVK